VVGTTTGKITTKLVISKLASELGPAFRWYLKPLGGFGETASAIQALETRAVHRVAVGQGKEGDNSDDAQEQAFLHDDILPSPGRELYDLDQEGAKTPSREAAGYEAIFLSFLAVLDVDFLGSRPERGGPKVRTDFESRMETAERSTTAAGHLPRRGVG
jgi:hypothetical protein